MLVDLTSEQEQLAELMSQISERCYYASWMQNLEYVLWQSLITGERNYGHAMITKQDISMLTLLSQKSKSWIIFDSENEETAINVDAWRRKFDIDIQEDPKILHGLKQYDS